MSKEVLNKENIKFNLANEVYHENIQRKPLGLKLNYSIFGVGEMNILFNCI